MKVLIVDDEAPARSKLKRFLLGTRSEAEALEAADALRAMELLEQESPDVLFLDVQMPGMTGLELIEAFGAENLPRLIFTTAYDAFAIEAFEHGAVDYLLKPFDQERFEKALDRATQRVGPRSGKLEQIANEIGGRGYLERFFVRENDRIQSIPLDGVLFIEADDKYVRIHSKNTKHYVRNTISNLEKRLDPSRFLRSHRSFIVNRDCVDRLESAGRGDYRIVLKGGRELPLSRRYSKRWREDVVG